MDNNDPGAILTSAFAALRAADHNPDDLVVWLGRWDIAEVIRRWPPQDGEFSTAELEQVGELFTATQQSLAQAGTGDTASKQLDALFEQLKIVILLGEAEEAAECSPDGFNPDESGGLDASVVSKWPRD